MSEKENVLEFNDDTQQSTVNDENFTNEFVETVNDDMLENGNQNEVVSDSIDNEVVESELDEHYDVEEDDYTTTMDDTEDVREYEQVMESESEDVKFDDSEYDQMIEDEDAVDAEIEDEEYADEDVIVSDMEVQEIVDENVADSEIEDINEEMENISENDNSIADIAEDAIESNGIVSEFDKIKRPKRTLVTFTIKLALLCLIPLLAVSVAIINISSKAMTQKIESQIKEALQIVAGSLDETYNILYTGDYSMDYSGKLRKGDTMISGESDLLDGIKEKTGYESSLVYGDIRRITTILREQGGVIVGTNVDKDIYKRVLKNKEVFKRNVVIQEKEYYAYYSPLVNSDGSVCGMVGAAKPAAEVQEMIKKETKNIVMVSMIIIVISMIIIILISMKVAKAMKKTKNFLAVIADGDLSAPFDKKLIKRKDELGDIYYTSAKLQQEFKGMVQDIKNSANQLITASDALTQMSQGTRNSVDEVGASVEVITRGATTQAEHTTTAVENLERIGEQIEFISEAVTALTNEAEKMAQAEQQSEVIIQKLNNSNEDTMESIAQIAKQIDITNSSIKKIRSATTMIQSISEETDLLSLNASIEAARAGEAGRGFAVVAEQICKLADQSNSAAERIADIIQNVMQEAEKMVAIMDVVKDNVDEQQLKLNETKDKFNAVAVGVETSRSNIDGILQKVNVLGDSSDAIRGVVGRLAEISEKNVESSEASMASTNDMTATMDDLEQASNNLREMANRLEDSMQKFSLGEEA